MTSRILTSGFDFWSCGHLCTSVTHRPIYTVVQKNAPTLAEYNYDPVQSILIMFSKLFTVYCGIMGWQQSGCSPFSAPSWYRGSYMQHMRGVVSSLRQTANVQMHSCVATSDAVSARPTCRNFTNCWRSVTMSSLIKLWTIHIIHFSRCFRQSTATQRYQLDNVLMIDSCQHIMDICLTVILLHDYCTQTYINLHKLFLLHCIVISSAFCQLS